MRRRCTSENDKDYYNYGERGIRVCPQWEDYLVFHEWARSNGYEDNLSLDRIKVDEGYSPNNCRWADKWTQANNTRCTNILEYKGHTASLSWFARAYGIKRNTLWCRLFRYEPNWDIGRALEDA